METLEITDPNFKPINRDDLSNWDEALMEFRKRPPRHRGHKMPYVVFGMVSLSRRKVDPEKKDSTYKIIGRCSLNVVNCFNTHAAVHKIDQYHKQGQKLLDFWFPQREDLPAKRGDVESGWIARLRDSQEDIFAELRAHCKMLMEGDRTFDGLQKERDAAVAEKDVLQKKVEKLQAELRGKRVPTDAN